MVSSVVMRLILMPESAKSNPALNRHVRTLMFSLTPHRDGVVQRPVAGAETRRRAHRLVDVGARALDRRNERQTLRQRRRDRRGERAPGAVGMARLEAPAGELARRTVGLDEQVDQRILAAVP